jgi:cyclase
MLTIRIIPCLDVDEGRVVKGVRFEDLKSAGDPVRLARQYNDQGADELVFLDIGASPRSRRTMIEVVEKVSREVFIPLTVGGGIRSVTDMRDALNAGADKVAVCTACLEDPDLLVQGSRVFGRQCLVLSIDAKRNGDRWFAYTHGGRRDTGRDAVEWAKTGAALGAGEILLNSIDQDGTRQGYDLDLTSRVASEVAVPVIASGGAGTMEQIRDAVVKGRADAVLLASLLHFQERTIAQIKGYLARGGVNVRW